MEKTKTHAPRRIRGQETQTLPAAAPAEPVESYNPDVQVIYGAGVQSLPLVGMSLAQARDAAIALLGVDRRAPALVNGRPAGAEYRIQGGDEIEFVHHAGEKG
jgi:hypothetical protein